MKKFLISIGVVGLVAVVAGIWTSASAAVLGQNDRNCTSTAVIICGAFKQSELDSRMTDSARAIFKDMGISTNLSAAQNGIVRANGNVELANGKVVATGVQVIGAGPNGGGHQFLSGDKGQYIFRKHSAYEALRGDDAEAFVFFNADGTFKNAIIKICGNPVVDGTPVKPTPKPSVTCDALKVTSIENNVVSLKATASPKNGAKVNEYIFSVYNDKGALLKRQHTTKDSTGFHFAEPGKYTANVLLETSLGRVGPENCKTEFTIPAPEKPKTPSIKIEKTVNKAKVEVNQEFTYTVKVTNTGDVDLKDAVVTDKQPANIQFISAPVGELKNGVWTTTIPTLKVKESQTFTIKAKATKSVDKPITNQVCVDTPTIPKGPDACDTVDIEVPPKTPVPKPEYRCELLTVEKFDADDVKFGVKHYLSGTGATYKSFVVRVYDAQNKEVYNTIDNKFDGLAPGKYTIKAFTTFTVDGKDVEVTSEACTAERTISAPEQPKTPSIKIEKTANKQIVEFGEEFNYTIKVTNNGRVDLKNAVVTDNQPAHIEFISATDGKIANGAWTVTIPTLKVGESKTFTVKAKVTEYTAQPVKNTVCVDTPTIPGDKDDCDDVDITVPPKPEPGKKNVCEIETKKIVEVSEDTIVDGKKYGDVKDCAETPTPTPETPTPTPETPAPTPEVTELPRTGASDVIISGLGLGALVTASIAYVASRRSIIG